MYELSDIGRTPLAKQVFRTIERHAMLAPGDKVLAAVSGGADSTALLHILCALATLLGIELAVAHLNHGLRGAASDDDARFVENMAGRLKLEFYSKRIRLEPSLGSLEEIGRKARYTFLHKLAQEHGYNKIALGHHMDDNAEAVLMHLLRGSGIRGLSGIPPVRGQRIIRPLMDLRRTAITSFLKEHHIEYVVDASNTDLRFDRNRVRWHLIPLLQNDYNSNVVEVLNRTADLFRQEERWLEALLAPQLDEAVVILEAECMALDIRKLMDEPIAVRRRLIRDGLRKWHGDLRGIRADHVDDLIGLLAPKAEGKRICLPNRIGAERTGSHLRFTIRQERGYARSFKVRPYYYQIPCPQVRPFAVDISEAGLRLQFSISDEPEKVSPGTADVNTAWFDADQTAFPLKIRNFRAGDRMAPFGMQGHQKIKKIFNDRKIPISQRERIPLLVSGDDIIWVVGLRRSALAVTTDRTTRVLEVRVYACDYPAKIPVNPCEIR